MHLTRGGSVQSPLTSGHREWLAGRLHFAVYHEFASWTHSPGGGTKESEA
jgi:hypothetical protein